MIENYAYTIVTTALSFVSGYILWAVKKRNTEMDKLEDRVVEQEKELAVLRVKIGGIRRDTQDIKGLLADLIKCQRGK